MADLFKETGHGMKDMVLDATEFQILIQVPTCFRTIKTLQVVKH